MKRNDMILLLGVLSCAALLWALALGRRAEDGVRVLVRIRGEAYAEYPLSEDRVEPLPGTSGTDLLVIKGGAAWVEEADCPDKYCIRQGKISKTGQQVICLPNSIVIEIIGGEETGLDAVVS